MHTETYSDVAKSLETLVKMGIAKTTNANLAPFSVIDAGEGVIIGLTFDDFSGRDILGPKREEPKAADRDFVAAWIEHRLVSLGFSVRGTRNQAGTVLEVLKADAVVARVDYPLGDPLEALAAAAFKAMAPGTP